MKHTNADLVQVTDYTSSIFWDALVRINFSFHSPHLEHNSNDGFFSVQEKLIACVFSSTFGWSCGSLGWHLKTESVHLGIFFDSAMMWPLQSVSLSVSFFSIVMINEA